MSLASTYLSRKQLLVNNLISQGVTGYTVDDGLTTLINAVLEISPQPLPYDNISLSSTKSIVSYAHTESTGLTARLLNGTDPVLESGININFYLYIDGNNDILIDTAQTDENGMAIGSYTSNGVGDIQIYAKAGNIVSANFVEIEDCLYWSTAEVSRTTTQGSTIYDNDLSQALTIKCEISYDMSADNVSASSERRFFLLPKSQFSTGTSQPTDALFSQIASSNLTIASRKNATNGNTAVPVSGVTANTYYNIKYVRDDTSLTRYVNDTAVDTISIDFLDNYTDWTLSMIRWSATGTSKLKNVKFKAL